MSAARVERLTLDHLPARPWKNGAGHTREIAVAPADAGIDHFDWRLSVAEVADDGPFSRFAGVDRQIVLWRGAGMRLHDGAGLDHRLDRPGVPFAFPGEAAVQAALIDGPTRDVNVMTRRGAWRAEVLTLRSRGVIEAADACLLLCGAGRWRLAGDDHPIGADEGLLWRTRSGPNALEPLGASDAWLVAVRLCHDPAP